MNAKKKNNEPKDWLLLLQQHRYAVVFLFAFLLYVNSISNNYNLDDELVTRNHRITSQGLSFENLQKMFTEPYYKDDMGYSYGYRPLTFLSFTIEHSLFGENAHVSHFINVLLYGLLCVVLLKVLELLFVKYNKWIPLITISLFVCYPLHTEVVDSIKNRDELLSFIFAALSLFFILSDTLSFPKRFSGSLLFFIAGLLSKANLIMFPALIILALLFFKKENIYRLLLVSFIFSAANVFFAENVSDLNKISYVAANLALPVFFLAWFNRWFSLANLRKNIFHLSSSGESSRVGDKFYNPFPTFVLARWGYVVFLLINLAIAVAGFFVAAAYAKPEVLLLMSLIYAVQLFFFPVSQSWPIIILIHAVCLFFLASTEAEDIFVFFSPFFIFSNLSLVLNLKNRKIFTALLALGIGLVIAKICFSIFTNYDSEILSMALPLLCILAYVYHRHLHTTKVYQVLWLVVLSISGKQLMRNYSTENMFFYSNLLAFVLLAGMFGISYFKISLGKLVAYMTQVQILFLIISFFAVKNQFAFEFKNFNYTRHFIHEEVGIINSSDKLPTAIRSDKIDRPVDFVEIPVDYRSPQSIKIATSAYQFTKYIGHLVIPWPMSFYYGYKEIDKHHLNEPGIILSILLVVFLFLLAVHLATANPMISFFLFFVLLSILPYLSIIGAIPGMFADRYTFQSSFGFLLLVALSVTYFYNLSFTSFLSKYFQPARLKVPVRVFVVLLLCSYSVITFSRNLQWRDSLTLFRHDIEYVAQSAQAHNLLALHLVIRSNELGQGTEQIQLRQEAVHHFGKAIEIYPDFFNPTFDLGRVFLLLGMPDSALNYFKKSSQLDSAYHESHLNVGELLIRQGKFEEAIPYYIYVMRKDPTEVRVYEYLSYIYFQLKNYDLSIRVNRQAMQYFPARPNAAINIGTIYEVALNMPDSALLYYQKAYALNPSDNRLKQKVEHLNGMVR